MEYGSNEALFGEMATDGLALPVGLLAPEAVEQAELALAAVDCADKAVFALGSLAQNIALAAGASSESDGPRQRVSASAYAELDQSYRRWIVTLGESCDLTERRSVWQHEVRRIVERLGGDLADAAGPAALVGRSSGGQQRDAGLALVWFTRKLREVIPHAYETTELSEGTKEAQ